MWTLKESVLYSHLYVHKQAVHKEISFCWGRQNKVLIKPQTNFTICRGAFKLKSTTDTQVSLALNLEKHNHRYAQASGLLGYYKTIKGLLQTRHKHF